jgi:hypothetical protein
MSSAFLPRQTILLAALGVLLLAACTSQKKLREQERAAFLENVIGEYTSDAGTELLIGGVRVRMIADYAIYVERKDAQGVSGRIVTFEIDSENKTIIQRAMIFAEKGRWLDLRQNPELFQALLPQDVKPAGTCKMTLSEDLNSLEYSCSGGTSETFKRRISVGN